MFESMKREGQLVLVRVSLADDAKALTPASVVLEVRLTGSPAARGLASVYGEQAAADDVAALESTPPAAISALSRVTISAADLGIPVEQLSGSREESSDAPLRHRHASMEQLLSSGLTQRRARAAIPFSGQSWIPRPRTTLSRPAMRQLAETFQRTLQDGEALWLEFAQPLGYLPLVAWEEALAAATSAPVLRLTPHELKPVTSDTELVMVLCCSSPSPQTLPATQTLGRLLQAVRQHLPPRSVVHVFADALTRPVFEQVLTTSDVAEGVLLHPLPAQTSSAPLTARTGSTEHGVSGEERQARENPWMTWMLQALDGEAVDVVHWVSPGVFPDEGILVALDPAAAPRDGQDAGEERRTLRFVPVPALAEFLNGVGAWGAVFSSTGGRQSLLGLRATTDRLARARPGSVAMQNLVTDPSSTALAELYRSLMGTRSVPATRAQGVVLYTHPARTGSTPRSTSRALIAPISTSPLLDAYQAFASVTGSVIDSSGPTPAWVASAQRIAEQAVSRVVSSSAGTDPAAVQGLTAALSALQRVLAGEPASNASVNVQEPRDV
jgi:hypothetical protein